MKDRVLLITGGASGIGYEMGRLALEDGAKHLIIWDINEESSQKVVQEFKSAGYSASYSIVNIGNADEVKETAKKELESYGTVDFLINNAGVVTGKLFQNHSYHEIKTTFDVNILGMMYVTRAFLPNMIENGIGNIVNIASAAGLTPNPNMTVYASSKWAAVGWSESLRIELEQESTQIKVLTVMPSYINTGMFDGVKAPLLVPFLDPIDISKRILSASQKGKILLKAPFMVKLTPILRGILPARVFDFLAGRVFKVYESMSTFKGRKGK